MRRAAKPATSASAPGSSTANSSPPRRATVSAGRTADVSRCATSTSSRSPAAWPSVSFTSGDWYSEGAFLWEVHPWGTGTPKGHSSGSLIPGELVLLRGIPSGGPSLGGWYSEGAFLWEVHPAGAVPQ